MTEAEWSESIDPWLMLEFVRSDKGARNKKARRKTRLFACVCCRDFLLYLDQRSQEAVEASERYADGAISYTAFRHAWQTALGIGIGKSQPNRMWAHLAIMASNPTIWPSVLQMTHMLAAVGDWNSPGYNAVLSYQEQTFSNPFRPVRIKRPWLKWNETIIPKLAQAIYDERAFDQMPILADALEEAGCDNLDILHHCRQPREHVRGCWVIDLILDKK